MNIFSIKYRKQPLIVLMLLLFFTQSCKTKHARFVNLKLQKEALAERFVYAIGQKNIKNYNKAENALKKCIKINKNHASSLYHLADINLLNSKPNKALNYIDRAISNDKNNYWYWELKAKIFRSQNDYKNEAKVYKHLYNENSEKRIFLKMLIVAHQKNGDIDEAIELLNKKINLYGIKSKDVRYKEWMLARQGRSLEIIPDYLKLQKKYPENIEIVKKIVALYTKNKDVKSADEWQKRITNTNTAIGSFEDKLASYKKQGNTKEYTKTYNQAIKNENISIKIKTSIVKKALSRKDISSSVMAQIINMADTLAQTNYHVSELNEVVADNLVKIGEFKRALSLYGNAIKGNKTKFVITEKAYRLAKNMQDIEEIHKITKVGLQLFPSVVKLYKWKANAYLYESNSKKAKEFIELGIAYSLNDNDEQIFKLLKAQSDKSSIDSQFDIDKMNDEKVLIAYVEYLIATKKLDKPAIKYIEKANALSTEGKYDGLKAKVLFERGKSKDAKKICSQLLSKTPYKIPIIILMGDILSKEGNTVESNKYWKKALLLGSKNARLKQIIE